MHERRDSRLRLSVNAYDDCDRLREMLRVPGSTGDFRHQYIPGPRGLLSQYIEMLFMLRMAFSDRTSRRSEEDTVPRFTIGRV